MAIVVTIIACVLLIGTTTAPADTKGSPPPRTFASSITMGTGNSSANGRTLIPRADGLTFDPGWNAFVVFDARSAFRDRFSADVRFRLHQGENGSHLAVRNLLLGVRLGSWELSVGRATRQFGRGVRGHLLLDDNAAAFDLVEIRTLHSIRLPGNAAALGAFTFDLFNGVLPDAERMPLDPRFASAGRPVARPNLLGMRIGWRATDWLEAGATRTVLYGGRGRERYDTFGEWWNLFTAVDENRAEIDELGLGGDQLASVDVEVRWPWPQDLPIVSEALYYIEYAGTDVYASWQGDDTPGLSPLALTDLGVLQGGLLRTEHVAFHVEHARIHRDWYGHSSYPQGYTNDGSGLGHPIGGDASGWYFAASTGIEDRWRFSASLAFDHVARTADDFDARTWAVRVEHARPRWLRSGTFAIDVRARASSARTEEVQRTDGLSFWLTWRVPMSGPSETRFRFDTP